MLQEVHKLLRELRSTSGCTFTIKHDPKAPAGQVSATITISEADFDDIAKSEFERLAPIVGAEPEWFGEVVQMRNSRFKVTEILPGRSKNCVGITNIRTGKKYVISPQMLRLYFPVKNGVVS